MSDDEKEQGYVPEVPEPIYDLVRVEQMWADRSAERPGHFHVSLLPLGNLGLFLDQAAAAISSDREHQREQQLGRTLTESERATIEADVSRRILNSRKEIEELVIASARDRFENRPLNRHRLAKILRLAASLLIGGTGRPVTVLDELVYINFHQAREQLTPLYRKLRAVRSPEVAWRWLEETDPALVTELVERALRGQWFARRRPSLDRMAAELISDHHPGVSINTLIRYGRRRPLK